jgi:hypothetical protein
LSIQKTESLENLEFQTMKIKKLYFKRLSHFNSHFSEVDKDLNLQVIDKNYKNEGNHFLTMYDRNNIPFGNQIPFLIKNKHLY